MENQEKIWDAVAEPWKTFKNLRPVGEVVNFLKDKTGKILDLGCGSGRNFVKQAGLDFYGVDFSAEMLKHAREYADELGINVKLTKSNAWEIPFEDNFFDSAIFVAALHCIPGEEEREKSLRELFRVLKSESDAWISVWDKNQPRFKDSEKESFVPWKKDGKEYLRYYYLYEKDEFVSLLKKVGFQIIDVSDKDKLSGFYSKRNINITVRKP